MQPSDALLNATLQYLSGRPWREVTDLMDGWLSYGRQVTATQQPSTTTWSTPNVQKAHVPDSGSEGREGADESDDQC